MREAPGAFAHNQTGLGGGRNTTLINRPKAAAYPLSQNNPPVISNQLDLRHFEIENTGIIGGRTFLIYMFVKKLLLLLEVYTKEKGPRNYKLRYTVH